MKPKNKQTILNFFLFLNFIFIITLVSAAPPAFDSGIVDGLIIEYPEFETIKYLNDFEFNFHVYNESNGVPITSGISCYFNIYDNSGIDIVTMTDNTPANFEYSFHVKGANFSMGDYGYVAQCNNSVLGGYTSHPFSVTRSGFLEGVGFYLVLLLIFIVIMGAGFYLSDPILTLFGSLALYPIGIYSIVYGIAGVQDKLITIPLGITILGIAFYISIRSAIELIENK